MEVWYTVPLHNTEYADQLQQEALELCEHSTYKESFGSTEAS